MISSQEGRPAMVVTLHRFFDRLFGDTESELRPVRPQPTRPESSVRRGIPDGYLDKLPPPEERTADTNHPQPRSTRPRNPS
jgi:hypothetical protein